MVVFLFFNHCLVINIVFCMINIVVGEGERFSPWQFLLAQNLPLPTLRAGPSLWAEGGIFRKPLSLSGY